MSHLDEGDPCPDFDLPKAGGGTLSRADLAGRPFVLYFYPKDDTSGCTREALDFTEKAGDFAALGVPVVGVSKDEVKKHDKFIAKHGLSVVLVSDAESDLCERAGVWTEKSMYGKTYMGIERTTLLVDASGNITRIWRKVKVPGHVEEVLAAAKNP